MYQRPVTEIPLNVISDSDHHADVSPASASVSINPHHQQQLQQSDHVDIVEEHQHYEIINEASSTSSAAAAAVMMTTTMTSSDQVTEIPTPTRQAHLADAAATVYLGLDTATMSEPVSTPSVYETLTDANPSSSY